MKHFPHLSKSTMASSFSVQFLVLLVFTVFSIVNTQAQTETLAAEFNFDAWVVETDNGTIIAAGEDYNSYDAIVRVRFPNGTMVNKNFLHTVQSGANANATHISENLNNGTIAASNNYFFINGITSRNTSSNIIWYTLRKYDYSSSPDPLIEKTIKEGSFRIFYINNNFIIDLYKEPGYDPMGTDWYISGPDYTHYMFIIDEYGNKGSNPVYQLPGEPEIVYKDVLQPTPSGNVAVQMHNGDLIEVNLNTGNFVRTIVDGMQAANHNVLTTNDNTGEEEVIQGGLDTNDDLISQVYNNGNESYKTDLPNPIYNNFGYAWDSAKKINGVWHMTRSSGYFTLDSTMVHGETHVLTANHDYTKIGYANDDGTYTFVVRVGNAGNGAITRVYHVVPPAPQIPQLNPNSGDSNVQAVFNSQVYNSVSHTWENGFYESTMAVTHLPAIGSTANTNWIIIPDGYQLSGYLPVEEITRNGKIQRICRARFRIDGNSNQIQLKIRFELASEVLGVEQVSIEDFGIYPNPMQDVLHIKTEQEISSVKVYNLLGQEVLQKNFSGFSEVYTLDVSRLGHGHYIAVIETDKGVFSKKIKK